MFVPDLTLRNGRQATLTDLNWRSIPTTTKQVRIFLLVNLHSTSRVARLTEASAARSEAHRLDAILGSVDISSKPYKSTCEVQKGHVSLR
jgi:hypothetical protein